MPWLDRFELRFSETINTQLVTSVRSLQTWENSAITTTGEETAGFRSQEVSTSSLITLSICNDICSFNGCKNTDNLFASRTLWMMKFIKSLQCLYLLPKLTLLKKLQSQNFLRVDFTKTEPDQRILTFFNNCHRWNSMAVVRLRCPKRVQF